MRKLKNLKTFEEFNQDFHEYEKIDEIFGKKMDLATKAKAIIKYYIDKNNSKNLKYWFGHIESKDLNHERLANAIDSKFNTLESTKGAHVFGEGSGGKAGFAEETAAKARKNPNVFDVEVKEKAKQMGFDVDNISKKLKIK